MEGSVPVTVFIQCKSADILPGSHTYHVNAPSCSSSVSPSLCRCEYTGPASPLSEMSPNSNFQECISVCLFPASYTVGAPGWSGVCGWNAGWWVCEKEKQGTGHVERGRSTSGEQRGKDGQSTYSQGLVPRMGPVILRTHGTTSLCLWIRLAGTASSPARHGLGLTHALWPWLNCELSSPQLSKGYARCFLSVSAMNGEAPGPEMASHTHGPTQGLGRTP